MQNFLQEKPSIEVFGCQWGDEGKGKIVDWLAEDMHAVIRFQGGHNAGHTLVVGGKTIKLNILPSGAIRDTCTNIIGNGVVVDPFALVREIENLEKIGYDLPAHRLRISERAVMILPLHAELDQAIEAKARKRKIGTTGRGIGPAYEDKVGRRAFHMGDLLRIDTMASDPRMEAILWHHNALRSYLGLETLDSKRVIKGLDSVAEKLCPYLTDTSHVLHNFQAQNQRMLFEGAQGAMLDIDHGTYPYVTSSNTFGGISRTGTGCALSRDHYVLGVAKAYATRVGHGKMVSEIEGELGKKMVEIGGEFGTVTGRERRCGWFDLVAMKKVCATGGVDGLALTKLDVLDHFDDLYICEAYTYGGKRYDRMPTAITDLERMQPVLRKFEGWKGADHRSVRNAADIAPQAKAYISHIETVLGVPVKLLSVGADREATIEM